MTTDASLLTLVQWLSPAFPTGAFAYSHGLEWEIERGGVTTAATLEVWLSGVLAQGAGRQDAILTCLALAPSADHDALDAHARALAPSRERLAETCDQGAAFARTVAAMTGQRLPPRTLPVAVGEAAAPLGLAASGVAALTLHAFAANLVSCAVRLVPLGQTEGQAVLAGLHPLILSIAAEAATATLDDLGSAAFAADLASMLHETQDVRIFRT